MKNSLAAIVEKHVSFARGGYRPEEVAELMRIAYEAGRKVEQEKAALLVQAPRK